MKPLIFTLFVFITSHTFSQSNRMEDEQAIRQVMNMQQKAWNANNLDEYMQGYWKSDSLKFYGSSGITKGWQKTLDKYKTNYPSEAHIGTLTFKLKSISPIEANSYYVMGQYLLKRTVGDLQGEFLIILKKINGNWKIIADMSN